MKRLFVGSHPIPPLTAILIAISVIVALGSGLGASFEKVEPLLISYYVKQGLPEVMSGEVWRLLTPIFIHFGFVHLAFNMLWLWDLGGGIERAQNWFQLALLVVVIGISSNLAQYAFGGPGFGGMSGVVYGLLAYIWIQGRFNPRFGISLRTPIMVWMLAWYVICWTGLVGPIANMAHTAGLVLGIAWGFTAAYIRPSRASK